MQPNKNAPEFHLAVMQLLTMIEQQARTARESIVATAAAQSMARQAPKLSLANEHALGRLNGAADLARKQGKTLHITDPNVNAAAMQANALAKQADQCIGGLIQNAMQLGKLGGADGMGEVEEPVAEPTPE